MTCRLDMEGLKISDRYWKKEVAVIVDEQRREGQSELLGNEWDWQIDHARRIYKKLNHREEYLALRQRKMIYGADFYDLATFYWESGEKEKALQVAEKGLQKGKGRMDELRHVSCRQGRRNRRSG